MDIGRKIVEDFFQCTKVDSKYCITSQPCKKIVKNTKVLFSTKKVLRQHLESLSIVVFSHSLSVRNSFHPQSLVSSSRVVNSLCLSLHHCFQSSSSFVALRSSELRKLHSGLDRVSWVGNHLFIRKVLSWGLQVATCDAKKITEVPGRRNTPVDKAQIQFPQLSF